MNRSRTCQRSLCGVRARKVVVYSSCHVKSNDSLFNSASGDILPQISMQFREGVNPRVKSKTQRTAPGLHTRTKVGTVCLFAAGLRDKSSALSSATNKRRIPRWDPQVTAVRSSRVMEYLLVITPVATNPLSVVAGGPETLLSASAIKSETLPSIKRVLV